MGGGACRGGSLSLEAAISWILETTPSTVRGSSTLARAASFFPAPPDSFRPASSWERLKLAGGGGGGEMIVKRPRP